MNNDHNVFWDYMARKFFQDIKIKHVKPEDVKYLSGIFAAAEEYGRNKEIHYGRGRTTLPKTGATVEKLNIRIDRARRHK